MLIGKKTNWHNKNKHGIKRVNNRRCPPCKGFTPQLASFYDDLKDRGDFEIVFVSSDKSDSEFEECESSSPTSLCFV